MTDEILCVVNENDEIIDRRSRPEIHRLGLRHRAVHILIFNTSGQLFLQLRSRTKDINPGLWDSSAAGHVECGEDYDPCALREVSEELGISLTETPEHLLYIRACSNTGMEFIRVYRVVHNGPFQLNAEEIDEGKWVDLDQMNTWVSENAIFLTKTVKYIWHTLQNEKHLPR